MSETAWQIELEGRSWSANEAMDRYFLTPEKTELVNGKLFDSDEDRETMLCLLLENVGVERAVQFGSPEVWRAAIERLNAGQGDRG